MSGDASRCVRLSPKSPRSSPHFPEKEPPFQFHPSLASQLPPPISISLKSPLMKHTPPAITGQAEILGKQARMLAPTRNLLFLLFLAATWSCSQVPDAGASEPGMVPMATAAGAGYSGVVLNETRRRLGSFQLCAPCTCCGGPRGVCVLSPCCYAIKCNIPNRPFGFCSFTPRSCDCLGCNL